jgi:Putative peptidoglycan binding domain
MTLPQDGSNFTALGPHFIGLGFPDTGFSTVEDGDGFQYGVRVNAARCGVVGQTTGGIASVLGRGFSQFGVLGAVIKGGGTGVVGASVGNDNDLMNLNVTVDHFDLDNLVAGDGTGVLGKSGTGFGAHGISESNTGVVGASGTGFGVHGIGSGAGEGVRGSSTSGSGGVFESQQGAQLRLIPNNLGSPEGNVGGTGGELVATTSSGQSGQTFCLWFCTHEGDAASAVWQLVAGSRPYPGALIVLNSQGTQVKRIQLQLNLVAAAGLVVDGVFGQLTEQAVVDFQTAQQITPDGIVGPITWEKLFTVV